MHKLTFLLFLFVFSFSCYSQEGTLKGKVVDTLEKKSLANAVISLSNKTDSTLTAFVRSDKNGMFTIHAPAGKYFMLISYPKLVNYFDEIELKPNAITETGNISLTNKALLLKEIVIKTGQAIKFKGDTTEYAADSFVVREGATVEDLLKKLPGFQVNSKGEITAQGKKVDKVLVDGEEFFGDDPTMATQNIGAKAVNKVQVFDTKSDQQKLTGITTGNEGKTVNIQLKDDQKNGAFGKVIAATNFNNLVDAKGLYNKFMNKKKVSVYATKSDINTGSLNWQDKQKLGMEDDMQYDELGGYYFSFSSGDEFNDWSLRGLPHAYTAGGLFSNKWNSDKQNVNTSYRYNRLNTVNESSTLTQNILPTSISYRNKFTNSSTLNQQHAVNLKWEWKIDSLASIKFTSADIYKTSTSFNHTASEFLNQAQQYINKSDQARNNNTKRTQTDNQVTYKQLFKKLNRQLLVNFRYGITNDDNGGNAITNTQFFSNGVPSTSSLVDQMKTFTGESITWGAKLTYNEPLSAKWNLVLDYSYNNNNSNSYRNTFNKGNNGKYDVLDSLYSNNFNLTASSNSGTATVRYIYKKLRMGVGSGLSSVQLNLLDLDNKTGSVYKFTKFTPQAQFSYSLKQQSNISLNYRGTTRQPSIDQLQPIRDNNDPLNVFTGNPNLKVGFNHNVSAYYNDYKVLSGSSKFIAVGYSAINNAIVNFTTLDTTTGKQTYTPVNVSGNQNWNVNIYIDKGQGPKKLRFGINLSANGGRNSNFINALQNINNYTSANFGASIGYDDPDKKSFSIRPYIGHTASKMSLQPTVNNNYFSYGGNINGFIALPWKLRLSSDCNFDLREKIAAFGRNTNIIVWNANIEKPIFKDAKLVIIANDILDQNKGYSRVINNSFITDDRYSRISRYFLLKFEWSFTKTAGKK